jgi:hypothetical protein
VIWYSLTLPSALVTFSFAMLLPLSLVNYGAVVIAIVPLTFQVTD